MEYIILTESGKNIVILDPETKKLLKEIKGEYKLPLIEENSDGSINSNFVGKIVTPNQTIFSLPKTIKDTSMIPVIENLLNNYKKNKLSYNNSFTLQSDGNFKSESYFLKRLKSFFLDFVTYEFIYPLETKKIHSIEPMYGKIDMVQTKINRNIYGDGITYDVVDIKNDDTWLLDDIYYYTIEYLAEKVGTISEFNEIKKMKEYLNEESGFSISDGKFEDEKLTIISKNIKNIELDTDKIIENIKKCNVNIVHEPIKKTLLDFYKNKKLGKSNYKIDVFFTPNFHIVWENITQKIFKDNIEFRNRLLGKFNKIETISKWIRTSDISNKLEELKDKSPNISKDDPNIIEWRERSLIPDIFAEYILTNRTFRFIGDAKYYNYIDKDYSKEQNEYNDAMDNQYAMCIFVPRDKTTVFRTRSTGEGSNRKQIIIFEIDIKQAITDYLKNSNKVLEDVHRLISKYINSERRNKENGFQNNIPSNPYNK
jgi:hypothetical protein